jgi:translocator protein
MNRDLMRQLAVAVATVAVIVVNALADIVPFNGVTTAQVSDRFQVFFTPAGYVFSIWGVIYIGLIAYTVYQFLPSQRENPRLRAIGYLYVLSFAANIVWLFLWHYLVIPLTVPVMLALLLSLIAIYLRLGVGRTSVSASENWLVRVPFSVYLGWITVATVANITDLLAYYNWDGFGISPITWTIIAMAVAAGIAAVVSVTRGDVAYDLVIIWAFIGIAVRNAATPQVATPAYTLAAIVAVIGVLGYVRSRQLARPPAS